MSTAPLLRIEGIAKAFGVVRALRGVTFDVAAGAVTALVGENGAGKSTLLRVLEGEHVPDAGRLVLDGREVRFADARAAHAAGIRVVHQEPEIIPALSVAENIFLGDIKSRIGGLVDWVELLARARELLGRFGLEAAVDPRAPCRGLGPAQRQLIEIMRGLRPGVRLLCLDEPTSSLTAEEAQLLFAILRQLRAAGTAVVYISHRLREVVELADRIVVLRDGELVTARPADELDEAEIMRLMVGRPLGDLFDHRCRVRDGVVLEARRVTTAKVRDCSVVLHEGEIVGLGGLVGAGRSELARALFGADRLTAGEIRIDGAPVRFRAPGDAIRAGIGLVPEDRKQEALLLLRSIRDNISLCVPEKVSRLGFLNRAAERRLVSGLVQRLAVRTPGIDQEVRKLSGGNQQKVVFARWLARGPRVLILDEPTRGIDVGAKAEIYRLIEDLAAAGIALLLISSELPELLGLADRILVMRAGRIVGEVPRAAMSEAAVLELAMGHGAERAAA